MGKSSDSHTESTQTQNQTQNTTMTPTNPGFVTGGLGNIGGTIDRLNGADPYSFISGPSALQGQAGEGAGRLTGTPWGYDAATDVTRGIAQGATPDIASNIGQFMNPYMDAVVRRSLQGFDQNSALTNEQNHLNLGRDTTFGGSGAAITDALTRGQQALSRGQLQSGLLSHGFETALGGAQSQAQMELATRQQRLGAAGQIAGIANDYGATQRANVGTQATIGDMLRQIQQQRATAPLTVAGSLASDYGTLPLGLLHGVDTSGTMSGTTVGNSSQHGSEFGLDGADLGKIAMAAAMFF